MTRDAAPEASSKGCTRGMLSKVFSLSHVVEETGMRRWNMEIAISRTTDCCD